MLTDRLILLNFYIQYHYHHHCNYLLCFVLYRVPVWNPIGISHLIYLPQAHWFWICRHLSLCPAFPINDQTRLPTVSSCSYWIIVSYISFPKEPPSSWTLMWYCHRWHQFALMSFYGLHNLWGGYLRDAGKVV